jgi:hypothetical protein
VLKHVTEISRWVVSLTTGQTVEVWADGYQELDEHYVFGVLADAEAEADSDGLLVTGRTPSRPERIIVALARFRASEVEKIRSA